MAFSVEIKGYCVSVMMLIHVVIWKTRLNGYNWTLLIVSVSLTFFALLFVIYPHHVVLCKWVKKRYWP